MLFTTSLLGFGREMLYAACTEFTVDKAYPAPASYLPQVAGNDDGPRSSFEGSSSDDENRYFDFCAYESDCSSSSWSSRSSSPSPSSHDTSSYCSSRSSSPPAADEPFLQTLSGPAGPRSSTPVMSAMEELNTKLAELAICTEAKKAVNRAIGGVVTRTASLDLTDPAQAALLEREMEQLLRGVTTLCIHQDEEIACAPAYEPSVYPAVYDPAVPPSSPESLAKSALDLLDQEIVKHYWEAKYQNGLDYLIPLEDLIHIRNNLADAHPDMAPFLDALTDEQLSVRLRMYSPVPEAGVFNPVVESFTDVPLSTDAFANPNLSPAPYIYEEVLKWLHTMPALLFSAPLPNQASNIPLPCPPAPPKPARSKPKAKARPTPLRTSPVAAPDHVTKSSKGGRDGARKPQGSLAMSERNDRSQERRRRREAQKERKAWKEARALVEAAKWADRRGHSLSGKTNPFIY